MQGLQPLMNSTAPTHSRELGYAEGTLLNVMEGSARVGFFLKQHYFPLYTRNIRKNSRHKFRADTGEYKARRTPRMNDIRRESPYSKPFCGKLQVAVSE